MCQSQLPVTALVPEIGKPDNCRYYNENQDQFGIFRQDSEHHELPAGPQQHGLPCQHPDRPGDASVLNDYETLWAHASSGYLAGQSIQLAFKSLRVYSVSFHHRLDDGVG